jgi:hypothetical protein
MTLQTIPTLCHVGLAKCASTTLQDSWKKSKNYAGYFSRELVETVRESVLKNRDDLPHFKKLLEGNRLSETAFSYARASCVVISDERITSPEFENNGDMQLAREVQECLAITLEDCVDRVLMIVRDPLAWIQSAYYQRIKQGSDIDFSEFISASRHKILENLDLGGILARFARLDNDPVILPLELLGKNEAYFWEEYETRLNFPAPDWITPKSDAFNTNVTIPDTMAMHRRLNAALKILEASASRNHAEDQSVVQDGLQIARVWGVRRGLLCSTREERALLADALAVPKQIEPAIYLLDDSFADEIERKFIAPLRESGLFPYADLLDSYTTSLNQRKIEVYQ